MKRVFYLFVLVLSLVGCSKSGINARYYIRYEADFNIFDEKLAYTSITIATKDGDLTLNLDHEKYYSEVYGPVKAGFKAKIVQDAGQPIYSTAAGVRIYVCRGDEPFVLMASGNPEASYVIEKF